MVTHRARRPSAPNSAAAAERLRAHARLCVDVAQDCCSRETAADLERLAHACAQAAERIAPVRDTQPHTEH